MSNQNDVVSRFMQGAAPASSVSRKTYLSPLPSGREWKLHIALFLLTALTATFGGLTLVTPLGAETPTLSTPEGILDYLLYVPLLYFTGISLFIGEAIQQPQLLAQAGLFAGALLAILTAHESGHYIACRLHGVRATLPYFIPAPPLFLAGTFGAFIRIKSPIPSRRALFDIGLAGPIAGFLVALPIAAIAILTLPEAASNPAVAADEGAIYFNDPLLFRMFAYLFGVDLANSNGTALYFAAWIGLLVTSLNLLPVGQLDGGHAVYATLGPRIHYWTGRIAFVAMCALTYVSWQYFGSPSTLLYSLLLFFVLRASHPRVEDETEALGPTRIFIALFTLLVFILSFLPFPMTIT